MITYNSNQVSQAKELGKLLVKLGESVRGIASLTGHSKSQVHFLMTKVLPTVDMSLFEDVDKVLQHNKAVRYIRGGNATKKVWEVRKACLNNA